MKKRVVSIIITLLIVMTSFRIIPVYATSGKYMLKLVNDGSKNEQGIYQGIIAEENTTYVFSFKCYSDGGYCRARFCGNTFNNLVIANSKSNTLDVVTIEYNRGTAPTGSGGNAELLIPVIDSGFAVGVSYVWDIKLTKKGDDTNLLNNPDFANGSGSGWDINNSFSTIVPYDETLWKSENNIEDIIYDSKLNILLENKKNNILNSESGIENKGNVFYVPSGQSVPSSVKSGDTVLFQRGGIYKYNLYFKSGVNYGAYGTGSKPLFDASYTTEWTQYSNNIWVSTESFDADVGLILLNESIALTAVKKSSLDKLTENNDFYYNFSNKKIYYFSDVNPSKMYSNLKICLGGCMASGGGGSNIIIDNISFKYGGGHGIAFDNGANHITIQNCEFGYIGGAYFSENNLVRYGNAIQFFDACDNINVLNNYIYQVYDAGITHQSNSATVQSNIVFDGNLVKYCTYAIEFFGSNKAASELSNITYSNNILSYSGYGWGNQRPNNEPASLICGWGGNNPCENVSEFNIKNNVLAYSMDCLIRISYYDSTLGINYGGNSFYQSKGLAFDWKNSQKLKSNNEYALAYSVSKVDSNPSSVVYTDVDYNQYREVISYDPPEWNKVIIVKNEASNSDNWQEFGRKMSMTAGKTYVFEFDYFAPSGCAFEARISSLSGIKKVTPLSTNSYSHITLEYTATANEDIYFLLNNGSSKGVGYVWDIKISDKATGNMLSYTNSTFSYNGLLDWYSSSEGMVLYLNKKSVASFKLSTYDATVKSLKLADIDRDGFLNTNDVVDLRKSLLGLNLGYENLDVNKDETFDVRDLVKVKKMIATFEK